jgi:hypothetical protein
MLDEVPVLFSNAKMGVPGADLPFRIELWDDADQRLEELNALVGDFATASSAYEEAVRRRPGKLITLRQKARVIKRSR